jgi:hypothetical protein
MFWHETVGARNARTSLSDIGEIVKNAIENVYHIYESAPG